MAQVRRWNGWPEPLRSPSPGSTRDHRPGPKTPPMRRPPRAPRWSQSRQPASTWRTGRAGEFGPSMTLYARTIPSTRTRGVCYDARGPARILPPLREFTLTVGNSADAGPTALRSPTMERIVGKGKAEDSVASRLAASDATTVIRRRAGIRPGPIRPREWSQAAQRPIPDAAAARIALTSATNTLRP